MRRKDTYLYQPPCWTWHFGTPLVTIYTIPAATSFSGLIEYALPCLALMLEPFVRLSVSNSFVLFLHFCFRADELVFQRFIPLMGHQFVRYRTMGCKLNQSLDVNFSILII